MAERSINEGRQTILGPFMHGRLLKCKSNVQGRRYIRAACSTPESFRGGVSFMVTEIFGDYFFLCHFSTDVEIIPRISALGNQFPMLTSCFQKGPRRARPWSQLYNL